MSLARKLLLAVAGILVGLAVIELFLGYLAPTFFAGRWEDSILLFGLYAIGSVLVIGAVVVMHFVWDKHE